MHTTNASTNKFFSILTLARLNTFKLKSRYKRYSKHTNMFFLRHLPTGTYYTLTCESRRDLHHKIVCFRRYEDAAHIGDSLATYKHIHSTFPRSTNHVYMLSKIQLTRNALNEDIYVDFKDIDSDFVKSLNNNQLAMLFVTQITPQNELHYQSFEPNTEVDVHALNKRLDHFEDI